MDGKKVLLIEVTIPYEKDEETLTRIELEKEKKYDCLTPQNLGLDHITETKVVGLAIGAMGTINKATMTKLKAMKIATHVKALQMIVTHYAAVIWRVHEKVDG